jgi:hypothetical protein
LVGAINFSVVFLLQVSAQKDQYIPALPVYPSGRKRLPA